MSKTAAGRVFDAIFDTSNGAIAEAVQAGKNVKIPGFGKFATRKRAARKGRNPRTGAEIDIPEATVITFSPGKGLKETLASEPAARKSGGSRSASAGAKKSTTAAKKPAAKKTGGSTGKGSARA